MSLREVARIVLKSDAFLLRAGKALVEDLVIEKNLIKEPGEHTNMVPKAIAAQYLLREEGMCMQYSESDTS